MQTPLVWYDPKGLFSDYIYHRIDIADGEIAPYFSEVLYCFAEADSAYRRKNYAWAARILGNAIAEAAILSDISMTRNMLSLD